MILYSKDNKTIDSSKFTYFDEGKCAKVSKNGNIVLKIYFFDCKTIYRLSKTMFNKLKKLNDPNIVKLRNYYFGIDSDLYKLCSIDAYTMEYVEETVAKLTELNREQLIEIISSLDETIRKISKKGIILRDVNTRNLILRQDRIIIIDPDMFYTSLILPKEYIYEVNKNCILSTLNSIITRETADDKDIVIPPFFVQEQGLTLTDNVKQFLTEDTISQKIKRR